MSDLAELYRRAPNVKSPPGVDQQILAEARSRAPAPRRAWLLQWGPAVSIVCVGIIGLTMVLRSGVPPLSENASPTDEMMPTTEQSQQLPTGLNADVGDLSADIAAADISAPVSAEESSADAFARDTLPATAQGQVAALEGLSEDVAPAVRTVEKVEQGALRKLSTADRATARSAIADNSVPPDQTALTASRWLSEQKDTSYAIRLAVSTSKQDLENLVARLMEATSMAILLEAIDGQWLLVHGQAGNRKDAVALLGRLSEFPDAKVVSIKALKQQVQ